MKKTIITLIALCISISSFSISLWTSIEEKEIATTGIQKLFPNKYTLSKLDVNNFRLFQSGIPLEKEGAFPVIELPKPNGSIGQYYIYSAPMMAEGLAIRYPEIKTYTLIDIANPTITGKADFTHWGFHAKIFDGKNTYFIDPYKQGNQEWYLVYYKKYYTIAANEKMQCLVDEEMEKSEIQSAGLHLNTDLPQLGGLRKTFGTERRTYRLALACTMEYSAAVGGTNPTKATVLSAMVTTMNRVNGVFEREFSMKAQLIANTDDVIYLPGGTDPYTNSSGSTMLGQNSTTLQSVIGASNYDYGHVFSTGGGGIASFASVCRNSKARGVTGRNNPVGDPFDIDYVAHEMGHQFGGSHTFNSTIGSCGGNGSSSSSFEPGSATTIMGYAGLCGGDNIQTNSDDYYHTRSIMQMSAHMDGQGNCASKVNTNNTPPNLTSINKSYTIPYKTFFELEADASDADNNPMTYCWEQWDLGAYGTWSAISTGNPLFRSFTPSTSNVRMFPELARIKPELIKTKGEVLPELTRNVSFKVAVRDINNGYGSFNYSDDELEIQAINTGASLFRVTSQATNGTLWPGDSKQTVTWNIGGTTANGINAATVDIYFSIDSGKTYPWKMADNVPNDGSHEITVPNWATNYGIVKVKGHNNIFFDINTGYIQVVPQVYPLAVSQKSMENISIFPNPASGQVNIKNLPSPIDFVSILNTNGQLIEKRKLNNEILSIEGLSNGIYFIQLNFQQGEKTMRKIVVQN